MWGPVLSAYPQSTLGPGISPLLCVRTIPLNHARLRAIGLCSGWWCKGPLACRPVQWKWASPPRHPGLGMAVAVRPVRALVALCHAREGTNCYYLFTYELGFNRAMAIGRISSQ